MLPDEEINALVDAVRSVDPPGPCLEIGTAYGRTLIQLMSAFPPERRPPFVVIDTMTWFPDQLEKVRGNLAEAGLDPASVDFRVGPSGQVLRAWSREERPPFAFIFVDGNHEIQGVTADLQWLAYLREGGLVCFHDYAARAPGVPMALDRFLSRNPNYEKVRTAGSVLVVRKTAPTVRVEAGPWEQWRAALLGVLHRLRRSITKRLR